MHEDFQGPFWCADLIGANGKIARLHKGGPPTPPPAPPPVRQSNRQAAAADEGARNKAKKKAGYGASVKPQGSLLGSDTTGSKTLLG